MLERIERDERRRGRLTALSDALVGRLALPTPAWAMAALMLLTIGYLAGRLAQEPADGAATPAAAPQVAGKMVQPAAPELPKPAPQVAARSAERDRREVLVRFVYHDEDARSVAIVGDFNDWRKSATPMSRAGGAAWTTTVALAPGAHEYMFVVDGQRFVADPLAARYRDDGFGNKNALIELASADLP